MYFYFAFGYCEIGTNIRTLVSKCPILIQTVNYYGSSLFTQKIPLTVELISQLFYKHVALQSIYKNI